MSKHEWKLKNKALNCLCDFYVFQLCIVMNCRAFSGNESSVAKQIVTIKKYFGNTNIIQFNERVC